MIDVIARLISNLFFYLFMMKGVSGVAVSVIVTGLVTYYVYSTYFLKKEEYTKL